MWTVFRFSLSGGGERAYCYALDILRGAGFRPAGGADPIDVGAPFPAAVLADLRRTPADVTRVIFDALRDAGLRPVGVCGCRTEERRAPARGARA